MNQIAAQAEAEQLQEFKRQHRQRTIAKVRGAAAFLFVTALLAAAFFYRAELQQVVTEKFFTAKPTINGKTGVALNGIQENAAKRDRALEEISK